jgi:hypothetical protein
VIGMPTDSAIIKVSTSEELGIGVVAIEDRVASKTIIA